MFTTVLIAALGIVNGVTAASAFLCAWDTFVGNYDRDRWGRLTRRGEILFSALFVAAGSAAFYLSYICFDYVV